MASIIIIDDDEAMRVGMRLTLTAVGHVVEEARNGVEGLRLFAEGTPDLLITDIVMPEMDGLEVLMKLRAMETGVKVLAISGGGQPGARGYLRVARFFGARHVLAKPFNGEALLKAVDELLGSRDTRDAPAARCLAAPN